MNTNNKTNVLILTLAFYALMPFFGFSSPYLFATIVLFGILNFGVKVKNKMSMDGFNYFDKVLIKVYLVWQIIIIARGLLTNFQSMAQISNIAILNQYSILAMLLPVICIVRIEQFDLTYLIKILKFLATISIVLVIINFDVLFKVDYSTLSSDESTAYATLYGLQRPIANLLELAAIGIFLPVFLRRKDWIFFVICGFLALFISLYAARRGTSALWILLMISGLFLYSNLKAKNKFLNYLLLTAATLCVYLYVSSNLGTTFSLLGERIDTDNRNGIELAFWADMSQSLDLLWGRGLNGTYFYPMQEGDNWVVNRTMIETGYCYLVLEGGLINLFLYCVIMIRAAFNGWYRSNNSFCKACSLFIVIYLLYLKPFGLPAFSLTYLFVWIGVNACLTNFRRKSDIEVYNLLMKK